MKYKIDHFLKLSFLIFIVFILKNIVFCIPPHITGKIFDNQPKIDYSQRIKEKLKLSLPSAAIFQAPISGTKKIAIIIVDFNNLQFTSGWQQSVIESIERFKMYYSEVSENKISLDITFFYSNGSSKTLNSGEIPYRIRRPSSYYAQNTLFTLAQLVKDALLASAGVVTKSSYDYVMVLHAGYGAESMPDPTGYIWSAYVFWTGQVYGFTEGIIIPEKEYNASFVGVVCHEFAHQIGLPDLYYQQYSIVGSWCLMDGGLWQGSPAGYTPTHLSCWAKKFLGWIDVEIISSTLKNFLLKDIKEEKKAIKIPILEADDPNNEYFLIEYRKKVNFDSFLKGEGLLIWHIDDNIASSSERILANDINSGEPHLGVDLIEADQTPSSVNGGDSGDPFPGSTQKNMFKPYLWNIYAYNNSEIKMSISNITQTQNGVNFDIIFGEEIYYNLTVLVDPPYAGRVSISSGSFISGSEIQVFAQPNENYEFDKWIGDVMSFDNPINIIMNTDKILTAVFIEKPAEIIIDTTPPAAITDLYVEQISSNSVLLTWTATGDDGFSGDIKNGRYLIIFSTWFETNDEFLNTSYKIEFSTNVFSKSKQSYKISSLVPQTTYFFGMFLIDESSNVSNISNIVSIHIKKYEYEERIYCELKIQIIPLNAGQVVIQPMSKVFLKGTTVYIYAEAFNNYEFKYWSGDVYSLQNPLEIIITTNIYITANFVEKIDYFNLEKKIFVVSNNNDNINDNLVFDEEIKEIKLFSPSKQKIVFHKKEPLIFDIKKLPIGVYVFEAILNTDVKKYGYIVIIK